ncbi:MAG TPA: oligosaccharide flippase family protein [Pseudoxanthomonas sp.]
MSVPSESDSVDPALETQPIQKKAGVGTHFLRYGSANFLIMLAGLISFPALTRLLDNTQYGILGYYETWVMIALALAKLGAQHAILRFYPHGGDPARHARFSTNLFLLPLLASTGLWALVFAVFVGLSAFGGKSFSPVLWCAVLAIPLMVFTSMVQMVLRAGERSDLLSVISVVWRWLELVTMVAAVAFLERSAFAAYGGKLFAAAIVIVFYLNWLRRNLKFSRADVDFKEFRAALAYGMPLVVNEIAVMVLVLIDRVMLKTMLDDYALVGIYTIGYALAIQVSVLMHAPLSASFIPVANRMFETEGADEVRAVKRRVLLPVTYLAVGVAVAIASVGSDVIRAISGPDKVASGPVFAWIGTMYALYPILEISGYGLLLHKRSKVIMMLTLCAAGLNILMNLFLIPAYGMMGAIYATAVSYAFLGIATCVLCPRELRQFPSARTLAIAVGSAALFLIVLGAVDLSRLDSPWLRLLAAGAIWVACFVAPVLMLDHALRRLLLDWYKRRKGRAAAPSGLA